MRVPDAPPATPERPSDSNILMAASIMDSLKGMFSGPDKPITADEHPLRPSTRYPDVADTTYRQKEGADVYGDPVAGYVEKKGEGSTVQKTDIRNIPFLSKTGGVEGKSEPTSPADSERIHRAWIAAQKSPVSKLGFSPENIVSSPRSEYKLNVGGTYDEKRDKVWYDENLPSTAIHESLHRGLKMLRDAGAFPKLPGTFVNNEEYIVRALMVRHFGDIEVPHGDLSAKEVAYSKKAVSPYLLDQIEKAAAEYVARKRPGGPR